MLRIAITPEAIDRRKEPAQVRAILEGGWDRVHLRHPDASRAEMYQLLESIPTALHDRLVVHSHFDLTDDFKLGGLHLNHRNPNAPCNYHGALSKSCHSIEEVITSTGMAYVTLSPIFDSISKTGYKSTFTESQFAALATIPTKVIALGGVTAERMDILKRYNFSGFAMLGALPWNAQPAEMSRFIKLIKP
ncbi:MAG: thiamine phosphate synthase [Bacteroides sp.]|nr:thiamine phosphate synthase [Bacteroides sp.]